MSASVRSRPPPRAVLAVLNPLVCATVGTPLWRLFPRWMAALEFTGRRSQKQYRVAVGVHHVNGIPTVFSERPWRLNFDGGAPLTVANGGTRRRAHGELVRDRDAVGNAMLTALRGNRPSNLGLAVEKGYQPTAADLAALEGDMIAIHYDNA